MMTPGSERFRESEMSKNVDVVLKVHQDMYNFVAQHHGYAMHPRGLLKR